MKPTLSLLFALFLHFTLLHSQAYFPDGTSWSISQSTIAGPQPQFYQFLCGDTMVNDTLYSKLYQTPDIVNGPFDFLYGIREDGEKVWYRSMVLGDALLYDFALQPNDVFTIPENTPGFVIEVETVTFEMINGVQRKKIKFKNVGSFPGETWWAGIGSNRGFGNRGTGYIPDAGFDLCCTKSGNGTNLYEIDFVNEKCNCDYEPIGTTCSLVNAVEDLENERFSFYPNPTSDFLFFEYQNSGKVEIIIFEATGRRLFSVTDENAVNISHLPAGMYWLQFTDSKSGESAIKKIIKTN